MYVFSLYQQYTVFLEVITVSPPVLSGALRNIVSKACICQLTNLAIWIAFDVTDDRGAKQDVSWTNKRGALDAHVS